MSTFKVNGEQKFQVLARSFSIGFSNSGYTLMYSSGDGNYTPWTAATPSNETCVVCGVAKNMFFFLSGNTGDVLINY